MSRARFALEVLGAWLMPWRAVREKRLLRRDLHLMIRVCANVAGELEELRADLGMPPAHGERRRLHAVD